MVNTILITLIIILGLWLLLEMGMRWYVESPLSTDFYASTSREGLLPRQEQVGMQTVSGSGWIHLGWVADPDAETYRIEKLVDGAWTVPAARAAKAARRRSGAVSMKGLSS